MILGGRAKEKNFTQILDYKKKINKIYLIGESAEFIFKQIGSKIKCELCDTLGLAIKILLKDHKKYNAFQTILFSPACTSFDQYKNFEDRGNNFKKIIENYINE